MATNADTGNGATISFGTSGWSGRVVRIGPATFTREALDNSHLTATGHAKKAEGDLPDAGSNEIEYFFRSDEDWPPYSGLPETVTITYPVFPGKSTPAKKTGTAFLTEFEEPELANNVLQRGRMVVTWDGETGPTWTKAT
jgi:hypothetical protein